MKCCNGDCCQGRTCPERTEFHWETTLENFGWFLAGVGFLALCVALLVLLG